MYGTVAKLRAKPGMAERLLALQAGYDDLDVAGFIASYAYRSDSDPDVYWLAVVFEDRESYRRNADDPAQDVRYRELRELLAEDPEWHDGEIVGGSR